MNFKEFKTTTVDIWHQYFEHLWKFIENGQLYFENQKDNKFLFPSTIIFTKTSEHYIAEFFGANEEYCGLSPKDNKEKSSDKYFYQFTLSDDHEKKAFITAKSGSLQLHDIRISIDFNENKVKKRFPHFNFMDFSTDGINSTNTEIPFALGEDFQHGLMSNFLLINTKDNFYRFKYIINLSMTNKRTSQNEYKKHLEEELNKSLSNKKFYGLIVCDGEEAKKRIISSQFANIYLSSFRETAIGEYLNKHPQIVKDGLRCESFLYEKELEWAEGNSDPSEKSIIPDLFLKRKNEDLYDICDLKLPRLDKKLTKGKHKRRRFYDYVYEGVCQLANYEDYFNFEKNKSHALEKHNIQVSEPKLYLIVGNHENYKRDEIEEASRMLNKAQDLGEKYIIIDYDTLNAMYLFNKI
ncbi:hypothetical protein MO867_08740 [Microbulbifer sp. OS29]|uniref:DUF4263 domain-containing protein n=1 Tax=Microbulbifer okhotskensis TaxID=2926617 RepID=A0A9X2J7F6_9GAMM|nr:hypothetical protein [Microbulbifer okhotskensis]MCO1334426.1 hypothetical protein [Microbulbifer okhotskensis]